ncbi:MAG: peptidoglycan-binding domain-containing protein, partial [Nocardioidaceae bacterium]
MWTLFSACTAIAMGAFVLSAGPAIAATPTPPIPPDLPKAIERLAPYQPQDTCSPSPKPGVEAFAALLLATYRNTGSLGISRACSVGGTSEHKEGRAFDWDVSVSNPTEHREAAALIHWLLATRHGDTAAMARRLGVMYIIWNGRIWGAYRANEGWRPYYGSNPHTSHVHFSFDWAGACEITSYWEGTVASNAGGPSCPSGRRSLGRAISRNLTIPPSWESATSSRGASHDFTAAVAALQRLLGVRVDGELGPGTKAAVKRFQRHHGLVADGIAGPKTWQ